MIDKQTSPLENKGDIPLPGKQGDVPPPPGQPRPPEKLGMQEERADIF